MKPKSLAELKRKASDIFSFILLSCPDFPEETKTTIAREFDELTELILAAADAVSSEGAKQWLKISLQEVQQSRRQYEVNDQKLGMDLIQRAEEHFKNAFSKKASTARFTVGEGGATHDTSSGFPQ